MTNKKSKRPTLRDKAQKEINRIKRFIKNAEKRGYRFNEKAIPTLPKRVTSKTLEKLKSIKPKNLYEKATAVSEKTGKIITGTQRRKEIRSIAASKAYKKRKQAEEYQKSMSHKFQQGAATYSAIINLINSFPTKGSEYLRKILDYEISQNGREAVIAALSEQPESAIQAAQEIVYYEVKTKDEKHRQLKEFAEMLKGYVPSFEEIKELGDIFEQTADYS